MTVEDTQKHIDQIVEPLKAELKELQTRLDEVEWERDKIRKSIQQIERVLAIACDGYQPRSPKQKPTRRLTELVLATAQTYGQEPFTISQIAHTSGLNRSSVYRAIPTLVDSGQLQALGRNLSEDWVPGERPGSPAYKYRVP